MLSICIPVYNFDITKLITELVSQTNNVNSLVEIIIIDDASTIEFQLINNRLSNIHKIKYVQLDENIGRSKIRNLFLKYINFDYLLFLDCDSIIIESNFIQKYLNEINNKGLVICGGTSYSSTIPDKEFYLRWKYGLKRECLAVSIRKKSAYQSFMTNNFVVKAEILKLQPFDEQLTDYGHEDTLFGFALKQNKIPITHINNTVDHDYDDDNAEFINKTELALKNLVKIRKFVKNDSFDSDIKILRIYKKISFLKVQYILLIIYNILKRVIVILLIKNRGGLYLFDFYKLLYLSKQINKPETDI